MRDAPADWFVYEHTVDGLFFKALSSRGVVEQGLKISGAKDARVLVSGFDGHGAMFHISWS